MATIADDNTHIYPGNYRAQVVENSDPLNSQRVQVRILGLHTQKTNEDENLEGIPDNDLPWAEQAGIFLNGTYIPKIGEWVWIFFENGNHNFPVYFAKCRAANDTLPETDNILEAGNPRTDETSEIRHGNLQIKTAKSLHGDKVEIRNLASESLIKMDTFNGKSRIILSADIIEIDGEANMGKGVKGYPVLAESKKDQIVINGMYFRTSNSGLA